MTIRAKVGLSPLFPITQKDACDRDQCSLGSSPRCSGTSM